MAGDPLAARRVPATLDLYYQLSSCILPRVETRRPSRNWDIGLPIISAVYNLGQTNSISGVFNVFRWVNDNDISKLFEPWVIRPSGDVLTS